MHRPVPGGSANGREGTQKTLLQYSLSDPEQYTLYLIQVLDADLAITPKSGTTTSDKKIKDINDSTDTAVGDVQDSADYDIGDDVPYVLTANLAENVSAYKKYHITFKDILEAGKLKNNKDYVVKINGTGVVKDRKM